MSIINTLREYLSEYEGVHLVLTDFVQGAGSYAVAQSAGGSITRDILGNKTYQNSYIFLAKESGSDEVDRRDNYDFLERFCQWLEDRNDRKDLPKLAAPYTPVRIEVSGVSLMDVEESGAVTYQVQLQFTYQKKNEVENPWLT